MYEFKMTRVIAAQVCGFVYFYCNKNCRKCWKKIEKQPYFLTLKLASHKEVYIAVWNQKTPAFKFHILIFEVYSYNRVRRLSLLTHIFECVVHGRPRCSAAVVGSIRSHYFLLRNPQVCSLSLQSKWVGR